MKDLIQWPRNKYLNIWVAASADGAAGYTYRPGAVVELAGSRRHRTAAYLYR